MCPHGSRARLKMFPPVCGVVDHDGRPVAVLEPWMAPALAELFVLDQITDREDVVVGGFRRCPSLHRWPFLRWSNAFAASQPLNATNPIEPTSATFGCFLRSLSNTTVIAVVPAAFSAARPAVAPAPLPSGIRRLTSRHVPC